MSIFAPLQLLADWLTFDVFTLTPETHLADAVNFFLFDTTKILVLLAVVTTTVSFLRTYLPAERIRDFLSKKRRLTGHVLAGLLGIVTPFCSCSAVPLFLGFVEAGVPLGITFTFLVSSPMINEIALALLFGLFGWKISAIYIGSGLLIAIFSGFVIGTMHAERLLVDFVQRKNRTPLAGSSMPWKERVRYALGYMGDILRRTWLYIVIGVGIGAWIHGYVPAGFLASYAGSGRWYAVPLATLAGIPLYSNAAGVIPLVSALTEKGVAMGTALAFMMAVTGLSLPEFIILKRVMKTRLIAIFAAVVGVGIIITGYLFNAVLYI